MKLTKYFMPFAALALLASCTDDKIVDGPNSPVEQEKAVNDLFLTLKVNQAVGTRTVTTEEGIEQGKDYENTVADAIVIFAANGAHKIIAASLVSDIAQIGDGLDGRYAMTFSVLRDDIVKYFQKSETGANGEVLYDENTSLEYNLYFIANPSKAIKDYYVDPDTKKTKTKLGSNDPVDLQYVFGFDNENETLNTDALKLDPDLYWKNDYFLMSNADYSEKRTLTYADIKPGTHTTEGNPLDLGEVKIQRAMSRFDLYRPVKGTNDGDSWTNPLSFTVKSNLPAEVGSEVETATVTFTDVAMVNEAISAYMFKVVGDADVWSSYNATEAKNNRTNLNWFASETKTNYVFTPTQIPQNLKLPLFTWTPIYDEQEQETITGYKGTQKDLSSFSYTSIETGLRDEDNAYSIGSGNGSAADNQYYIWRYAMENSINPVGGVDSDQRAKNSTGVIFKAQLTGSKFSGTSAVYALNNTVIGPWADLLEYAPKEEQETPEVSESPEEEEEELPEVSDSNTNAENIQIRLLAALSYYNKAQKEANENNTWVDKTLGDLTALSGDDLKLFEKCLVKAKFTIYRPTGDKFYCYYTYWNRHNDNSNPALMGAMEFATVRNNVYKLKVNKVNYLGHPADPNDDPDPIDPDDPDETDKLYCEIICRILPWSVRINGIEF